MSREDIAQARIEAALYSAGRPLTPEELTKAAGITSSKSSVKYAKLIAKNIEVSMKAIEVAELPGQKFVMQLKPEYNIVAKTFALKPLLPNSILKTLTYVVYFQPITSLKMSEYRGSQVYQHLKTLEQTGFISSEKLGRTKVYKTTNIFSEYFGLSDQIDVLKRQLVKTGRLSKLAETLNKPLTSR